MAYGIAQVQRRPEWREYMEKVIEVQGLKREYITKTGWFRRKQKKVMAVNGIDFSVERGEIFGLLGENGAGKTNINKT